MVTLLQTGKQFCLSAEAREENCVRECLFPAICDQLLLRMGHKTLCDRISFKTENLKI